MARRIARHSAQITRPALLAASLLAACTQWQVQDVPPQQLLATQHPERIRIMRPDSSTVVLSGPEVLGDTLYGTTAGRSVASASREGVPLGDIAHVSVRRTDPVATALLIVVPVGVLVVTGLMIRTAVLNED